MRITKLDTESGGQNKTWKKDLEGTRQIDPVT